MDKMFAIVHNHLPHGDVVEQFSENDRECFEEIRDVLKRHGKLDRFGITLLHKHFELQEDEMLVENVDEENRIQTIQPMKKTKLKSWEVKSWKHYGHYKMEKS